MAGKTIAVNPDYASYNKYDFTDTGLNYNKDDDSYSWTDKNGNSHNLTYGKHSITAPNGTVSNWEQWGTKENEYIRDLYNNAKKTYKKNSKATKNNTPTTTTTTVTPTTTPTATTTPSKTDGKVIVVKDENGNNRKVGVSSDTDVNALTGSAIANSYKAIAEANVGDFWIDSNNIIHVVTQGDINYCKGKIQEDVNGTGKSDDDGTRDSTGIHKETTGVGSGNKDSDTSDGLPDDVDELRKKIAEIEDKGMGNVYPSTSRQYQELTRKLADITNDPADLAKAVAAENAALAKNPVLYKNPYDTVTESAGSRSEAQKATESMEGQRKPIRSILGDFLAGEYGNLNGAKEEKIEYYDVYDADGNIVSETPLTKQKAQEAIDYEKAYGKEGYTMKESSRVPQYKVYDRDGKLYGIYESELAAKNAKKDLNKENKKERQKAWTEFLTRGINSFATAGINSANDVLGKGDEKSLHQQDLEDRIKYNNELYYDNEKLKSENVRNLAKLSDEELAKIVGNSNSNTALLTYLIGQKRVNNIMDILDKQVIEQAASEAMANWTPEQKSAYYTWTALVNNRDINDKLAGLISGKTSLNYFANLWKKKTNIQLAKDSEELIALEKAIEASGLQNKMTEAQVDVIRELVAEQLQSAKLGNAQKIQEMATSSVDSLAKIIDAIVPM
jgi:hypothetical protein